MLYALVSKTVQALWWFEGVWGVHWEYFLAFVSFQIYQKATLCWSLPSPVWGGVEVGGEGSISHHKLLVPRRLRKMVCSFESPIPPTTKLLSWVLLISSALHFSRCSQPQTSGFFVCGAIKTRDKSSVWTPDNKVSLTQITDTLLHKISFDVKRANVSRERMKREAQNVCSDPLFLTDNSKQMPNERKTLWQKVLPELLSFAGRNWHKSVTRACLKFFLFGQIVRHLNWVMHFGVQSTDNLTSFCGFYLAWTSLHTVSRRFIKSLCEVKMRVL